MRVLLITFICSILMSFSYAQGVSKDSIETLKLREKILSLNAKINSNKQEIADDENDIVSYQAKLENSKRTAKIKADEAGDISEKVKQNSSDQKLAKKAKRAYSDANSASKDVAKYQSKIESKRKSIAKLQRKNDKYLLELNELQTKIKFVPSNN